MAPDSGLEEKMQDAKSILLQCVGEDGIWADATRDGYKNIYFTRDLAIAAEGLVAAGLEEHVQKHLNSLAIRQGEDGGIPVFFIGNYRAWALQKLRRAFIDGELLWMIMKKLNNYFPNFVPKSMGATHDTTDSELQYIDAVVKYARLTGDTEFLQAHHGNMKAAFQFSQSRVKDGLYRGVDWRDNVRFPPDVALLSNNALLVRAYKALNLSARTLKERINDQFWNGEYHTDQPNVKDFDAFGQALAVLNDIPTAGQYTNIARKFESLVTNVGIKANDLAMPNDMRGEERVSVERVNQYETVWPFVTGYVVLALNKMGKNREAKKLFTQWTRLEGFREWYNAETGQGGGAQKQMWSAALYIAAGRSLGLILS